MRKKINLTEAQLHNVVLQSAIRLIKSGALNENEVLDAEDYDEDDVNEFARLNNTFDCSQEARERYLDNSQRLYNLYSLDNENNDSRENFNRLTDSMDATYDLSQDSRLTNNYLDIYGDEDQKHFDNDVWNTVMDSDSSKEMSDFKRKQDAYNIPRFILRPHNRYSMNVLGGRDKEKEFDDQIAKHRKYSLMGNYPN